jgi:hypothetical protein
VGGLESETCLGGLGVAEGRLEAPEELENGEEGFEDGAPKPLAGLALGTFEKEEF